MDRSSETRDATCGSACSSAEKKACNVGETERALSVAAGSFLAVLTVRHFRGAAALAGAVTAGGLICRGVTGHCAVYEALGVNTNEGSCASSQRDETRSGSAAPPGDVASRGYLASHGDAAAHWRDQVDETSDESFPASDPPAWSGAAASRTKGTPR